jgi:hypothetical protein
MLTPRSLSLLPLQQMVFACVSSVLLLGNLEFTIVNDGEGVDFTSGDMGVLTK